MLRICVTAAYSRTFLDEVVNLFKEVAEDLGYRV
jgi:hypothetical protein